MHVPKPFLPLAALLCVGFAHAQTLQPRPRRHRLEAPPARATAIPDGDVFGPRTARVQEPPHVHLATGEFQIEATDLFVAGRGLDFELTRKYRSRRAVRGPVGVGWDHSYDVFVTAAGSNLLLHDGHTRRDLFVRQADGTYVAAEWMAVGLDRVGGAWELVFPDGGKWSFGPLDGSPAAGRIDAIADRNQNTIAFQYDAAGRLETVVDTLGRSYDFQYDAGGLLASVTDFTGRQVVYEHYADGDAGGGGGDLKSVRSPVVTGTPTNNDFPNGRTTTYTYTTGFSDKRLDHNLLTVTDPKGQTYLVNTYAATLDPAELDFDRLVDMRLGEPGDDLALTYTLRTPSPANRLLGLTVEVVDRSGFVDQYDYDAFNRCIARREYTAGLHAGEPAFYETAFHWNADSLPTLVVLPEGNFDQFVYEGAQPGTPARSRGNLVTWTRAPGPRGADQPQLVETFEYDDAGPADAGHNHVTRHVGARGGAIVHVYDAAGNRIRTEHRIPGLLEDWEYNAFGQVIGYTHPDDGSGSRRVDVLTYFDSSDGAKDGYLESRTDDVNGFACTTLFDVDERGNVVAETDPAGNERLLVLNDLDEVVRRISPETAPGSGVRYETDFIYDADGNVVREDRQNKDENGLPRPNTHFTSTFDYDVLDQLVRATREVDATHDAVTEYGYDANQNRTLVRKGEAVNGNQPDNVEAFVHDERDLLFRRILAPGAPEELLAVSDFDGNGNAVRAEANGRVATWSYDGYDREIERTDPMGNVTTTAYDANGNRIHTTVEGELVDVPGGVQNVLLYDETRTHDPMDRVDTRWTAHLDPGGAPVGDGSRLETWVWTDTSEVRSYADDGNNTTLYLYDSLGRLMTEIDALGNERRLEYDCGGNVTRAESLEKSDLGNPDVLTHTLSVYDGLDRLVQETTSMGRTTTYAYDSDGNQVATVDAEGQQTVRAYDGLGRLTLTVEDMNGNGASAADSADVAYGQDWDDSGRCVVRTDPDGNATTYAYDPVDCPTSAVYADGTSLICVYDNCGNAVSCTDPNGTLVDRQYDELGRPRFVNVTPGPGVGGTTFEVIDFDGLSRLVSAQDDDSQILFQYDSLSNPVVEIRNGQAVLTSYDAESNLVGLAYPHGKILAHQYDALNRRKSVADAGGQLFANEYAGPARLEGREMANNTATLWAFDPDLRPVQVDHVFDPLGAGIVLDARAYGLDGNGNIHTEQDLVQGTSDTFVHDALDRLVHSNRANPPMLADYDLDHAGNRLNVNGGAFPGPYVLDPADAPVNQYTQTPMGPRAHDENGNVVAGAIGNRNAVFTYDYRDQLIGTTVEGVQSTYAYDFLGRRFAQVVDVTGTPQETVYVHSGLQVIEEQDGLGNLTAAYVYGEALDEVVLMERGGQTFFLHQDVNRSVTVVTDAAGDPVERYRYLDFGSPSFFDGAGAPIPASAVGNPYLFTGRRLDAESGLYYFRARYLDPSAGRFISRDPIGIWGDETNLGNGFAFAGNAVSALEAQDPTGLRKPTKKETQFREHLKANGTSPEELESYDDAIAKAPRGRKIMRLRNGTWVPEKTAYRSLKALLVAHGLLDTSKKVRLNGICLISGCKEAILAMKSDSDLSKAQLSGYRPKPLPRPLKGKYVRVNGVIWVWRRGRWRPSTLEYDHKAGKVKIPTKTSGGKEVPDGREARNQFNGKPPKDPTYPNPGKWKPPRR